MVEELDRAEDRLGNIRSVEPILSALRTISHASWQKARRKVEDVQRIQARIQNLISKLPSSGEIDLDMRGRQGSRRILLAIGTQRGLCGQFNQQLLERSLKIAAEWEAAGKRVSFWVVGSRLTRAFRSREIEIGREWALSSSSLPDYKLAVDIFQTCLMSFKNTDVASIQVVYNRLAEGAASETVTERILPPRLPERIQGADRDAWPPPIIETNATDLKAHLLLEGLSIELLTILLESAAAEHSTRFHLMEDATQNADRLIDELNELVLTARRHAITSEMSELAVSSGLLGPRGRSE
ncbi:MAG: F0F1 ATP synthase subunit gamma [Anaerolineales bacterium]|nr:F0F1 ATP synthase subunit gamma [Anaerolineales bacterium]